MKLIRRNPAVPERYRPLFADDLLAPFSSALDLVSEQGLAVPRLDVNETEQGFDIQAELPGVNKEDVKVSVDHQRVTIEANTQFDNTRRQGENLLQERQVRRFQRSLLLPAEVDNNGAQASMDNGVLSLSLPKKQGSTATRLTVQ